MLQWRYRFSKFKLETIFVNQFFVKNFGNLKIANLTILCPIVGDWNHIFNKNRCSNEDIDSPNSNLKQYFSANFLWKTLGIWKLPIWPFSGLLYEHFVKFETIFFNQFFVKNFGNLKIANLAILWTFVWALVLRFYPENVTQNFYAKRIIPHNKIVPNRIEAN